MCVFRGVISSTIIRNYTSGGIHDLDYRFRTQPKARRLTRDPIRARSGLRSQHRRQEMWVRVGEKDGSGRRGGKGVPLTQSSSRPYRDFPREWHTQLGFSVVRT